MPILHLNDFDFFSRSPDQTQRIGMRLGSYLRNDDVVCMCGDLGSGKTTLVQGIARGWGALEGAISPTFVIVNVYHRPDGARLNHLDAYRLQNAFEAEDLDLNWLSEEGALLVEWADRIRQALPEECLWIDLKYIADEQREILFSPHGARYVKLVQDLKKAMIGGE